MDSGKEGDKYVQTLKSVVLFGTPCLFLNSWPSASSRGSPFSAQKLNMLNSSENGDTSTQQDHILSPTLGAGDLRQRASPGVFR